MSNTQNPEYTYNAFIGHIDSLTEIEEVKNLLFYIENSKLEDDLKAKLMQHAQYQVREIKKRQCLENSFVETKEGVYLKRKDGKPHIFTSQNQAGWQSILYGIMGIPTIIEVSDAGPFHRLKLNTESKYAQALNN